MLLRITRNKIWLSLSFTIKSGLLPHTPDWASDFRTTLEWHKDIYQDLAEKAGGKEGELLALLPRKWEFRLDPKDIGVIYQWYLECNSENWTEIDTTLNWEAQGYQDQQGWSFWGKAWYRTGFSVPERIGSKSTWLTIGAVYNRGVWVWFYGMMEGWGFQVWLVNSAVFYYLFYWF